MTSFNQVGSTEVFQFGLGAGLGMLALTENLDQSIKSADELTWLTGLPSLARVVRLVTPADIARKRQRRHLICSITGLSISVGIFAFHFFVMDLWIFCARLGRFVWKYL
jgi:hypothetical protein